MKKLTLTPSRDTITICLPEDWVGKPISCILAREDEAQAKMEVAEGAPNYMPMSSSFEENWNSELEDELWKNI